MPLMDCYLTQIDKGARRQHQQAVPTRISARPGRRPSCSRCGRTRLHTRSAKEGHDAWETHDVFSLPHGNWITHKADETATLFLVTDRDALRRLDLLKEQYGNEF